MGDGGASPITDGCYGDQIALGGGGWEGPRLLQRLSWTYGGTSPPGTTKPPLHARLAMASVMSLASG